MKRLISIVAIFASVLAYGQNTQEAAAEAAAALSAAEDVPEQVVKPQYWTNSVLTNINFGQTYLSQWAAGGYNSVSLAGNVDANANYARDKVKGANRLQLDYGFLYSADKPIPQKNKDRIYFESKWGYESGVKNLLDSGTLDFKTQFGNNYAYGTPSGYTTDEPTVQDWLAARTLKSGFFAPAYLNLGVGMLWTPAKWFSLNVAPLSGGGVFVSIPELRKTYGMDLRADDLDPAEGANYRSVRLEFGAQIKADMAWVINDAFSYTTQATLFYNYLTPTVEPRLTWDNKVFWKLAKYFALTVSTNLIYDPRVLVRDSDKDGAVDAKGVQFKEFLEFGFTYSIAHKR